MLLGEDGAARVGWVGDNQAGGPLVNQTLQMLEVDLPRLLRLQEQTCTSAEETHGESFYGDCLPIILLGHDSKSFTSVPKHLDFCLHHSWTGMLPNGTSTLLMH